MYSLALFAALRMILVCTGRIWRRRRIVIVAALVVIAGAALLPKYGITVQLVAVLFIPCGIGIINRRPYYWLRQLLFACGAISSLF